jgi:hypothetical protein
MLIMLVLYKIWSGKKTWLPQAILVLDRSISKNLLLWNCFAKMNRNLVGSTYGRFCIKFPHKKLYFFNCHMQPLTESFNFQHSVFGRIRCRICNRKDWCSLLYWSDCIGRYTLKYHMIMDMIAHNNMILQ